MSALALPLAGLAFCAWSVYLGGLAALQDECDVMEMGSIVNTGVVGISAGLPCSKVYRFHWFIMSWEFVVVALLAVAVVTGKLASMRTSFVGLFAIGTLLYIEASNTFLAAQSLSYYDEDEHLHRIRTITAGAIMTALMNAIIVAAVGVADEAAPAKAVEDKAGAV